MSTYSDAVLADGARSLWRLNEPAPAGGENSTQATDAGPAGVAALLVNNFALTYQVTGAIEGDSDKAISNSRSGQLQASGVYAFSGQATFSIEAWVKVSSSYPAAATIAGHYDEPFGVWEGYALRWTGSAFSALRRNTSFTDTATGPANPTLGVWHHVVMTYDGTTIRLYQNGALVASQASTLSISLSFGNGNTFIAWSDGGTSDPDGFVGALDELAVYESAISASDILEHYQIAYDVAEPPTITGITPSIAAVGDSITITGTRFGPTQGTGTVTFATDVAAVTYTSWTSTQIVVTIPAGAQSGRITVRTQGGLAQTALDLSWVEIQDASVTAIALSFAAQDETLDTSPEDYRNADGRDYNHLLHLLYNRVERDVWGLVVVTSGATYAMSGRTNVVVVNKATGSATAVTLPASPATGRVVRVKDGKGDAATNNITVSAAAGNIDGAASDVIAADFGARTYVYNGSEWNVID